MNGLAPPVEPACDDASLYELAVQLGDRLRIHRHMVCTAESCTGGWIAKMITDIPGCSDWFDCGLVAYSYEAKGALVSSGASLAVAVTGIAGPTGGTPGKPVGEVWVGWKRRGGYPTAKVFHFKGDREAVRRQTVAIALEGLLAIAG